MAKRILDESILQAAVAGGSFYGGGGGGSPALGLELGRMALKVGSTNAASGCPCMIDLDDLGDDDILLTVSAVGSPAGEGCHAGSEEYARAVELFRSQTGLKVAGLITNECGGLASVNGWIQSAATGLPIVDAPCNGRAHPTGVMGSMGLHLIPGYESAQSVVGGSRKDGTYVEALIRGSLDFAGGVVRQAAAHTGGLVAVARNPVTVGYAREHAAVGAVARCVEVGSQMLSAATADERIAATARASGGRVAVQGVVKKKDLVSAGGFDTGMLVVTGENAAFELTFWNEYITLEKRGASSVASSEHPPSEMPSLAGRPSVAQSPACPSSVTQSRAGQSSDTQSLAGQYSAGPLSRLATFPDLIATMDGATGYPVSSADVREGQRVAVIVVPASALLLGAGVKDRGLYHAVERTIGKEVIKYAFGG